ncbi:MAG: (5-formylfuran-3-yl)methyl phosphate synthase [Methyloceanibacter sp.]
MPGSDGRPDGGGTLFLASVRDAAEAELAIGAGADIVDLKDPAAGALGALAPETIEICVRAVGGRAPVSATVGDLPLEEARVRAAVLATASCGVDYVKIGLFPGDDAEGALLPLAPLASRIRLILVLFADAMPAFDAVALAGRIGAAGIMLDTMGKAGASLPRLVAPERLRALIAAARARGLAVGLAGSLRADDVPALLALAPDLLGFRGALCRQGKRGEPLDPVRLAGVRALIPASGGSRHANLPDRARLALC